ncbi:unnamed protein product [Rotaria sordida]|uniref:Uncharacterized protein n=2 Tax=Rotaria sordida TaxID=392033 RepID=A0A815HEU7_9BILA|nr:unnamed protein product [Rotaria sordida]
MNFIHTSQVRKRGYLTQAELFRYSRQQHDDTEIPYPYVYSSVKLRQQKRERQRMFIINNEFSYLNNKFNIIESSTSYSRQHHSTNTLDGQHITPSN